MVQGRGRGQGIEMKRQYFLVETCYLLTFSVPRHTQLYILMPIAANTGIAFDAPRQTLAKKVELLLQKLASPLRHFGASVAIFS